MPANNIKSHSGDAPQPIQTTPGLTKEGKPFNHYERRMLDEGKWTMEPIPADVLGLARPLEVNRAERSGPFVVPWDRDDGTGYCPKHWADLKIGKGSCGLRCRTCFLIATHRVLANPARHLLYSNTEKCVLEVRRWLQHPTRMTLGLGTDSSDSLLYEGVTGYARQLIPMVADPETNPHNVTLLLLTKTANVDYLEGQPTDNVIVSFSLNPEPIADLWEGKFDDGVRVTPPIEKRVRASIRVQELGFEVRWRVDPILTPPGWEDQYEVFFREAAQAGARPSRVTLGTYRENSRSLRTMAAGWGLASMEWLPADLEKDGMHSHQSREERVEIYSVIRCLVTKTWHEQLPLVALCKEPMEVRRGVGVDHEMCNCGPTRTAGSGSQAL